jgi:integrase/recombinase XerC
MQINKFIEYLEYEKGYSKHTLHAYQKDLIAFKRFLLKEYDNDVLSEVIYVQVRSWIVKLVNDRLTNRSVNRKISSLKSFYKYLEKIEEIKVNPLQEHHSLKTPKKTISPFSKKELKELGHIFKTATGFEQIRDYLIIELLYTTGMRRAELIGLKLTDISIENKTIKVLGKRNKERYIPLLAITIDLINTYTIYRNDLNSDTQELLLTKKGKPLYESLVYKIVTSYLKMVTTKDKKSPHILRHAFATHLLDEGADLNVVKDLLGHASLASTQIYTQSSLAHLKEVYKKSHPRNKK